MMGGEPINYFMTVFKYSLIQPLPQLVNNVLTGKGQQKCKSAEMALFVIVGGDGFSH